MELFYSYEEYHEKIVLLNSLFAKAIARGAIKMLCM